MAGCARTCGKMAAPRRTQPADDTDSICVRRGHQSGHLVECSVYFPVHNKIIRRVVFVILLLATVALVRLWPDNSAKDATSFTPAGKPRQLAASASTVEATPVMSTAPVARGTAASDTPPRPQAAPVQIDVRTPATVRSGESFQVTVDLEAHGGIRQLAFSVSYNQRVLQLLGASESTFQQGGIPTEFGAEEPSDGNILVKLDVNNGPALAGAGSVIFLQFQALKAGTSPVTVHSITFVESGSPRTSTTPSVHQGLVKVE
jgi:hypothetical protein